MRRAGKMEDVVFRFGWVRNALNDDLLAGLQLRFVLDQDLALSHRAQPDGDPCDGGGALHGVRADGSLEESARLETGEYFSCLYVCR